MSRPAHLIFSALAVASAALCCLTAVVWIRSLHSFERWTVTRWRTIDLMTLGEGDLTVSSSEGRLTFVLSSKQHNASAQNRNYFSHPIPGGLPPDGWHVEHERHRRSTAWSHEDAFGISAYAVHYFQLNGVVREIRIPHWFAYLATAALPTAAAARARWRRRYAPGSCPRCNYDLRATPDRCPECGTIIVTTKGPGPDRRVPP